jgi:hypothetical protein
MSTTLAQYTESLTEKLSAVIQAFRKKEAKPELETMFSRWETQLAHMRSYAEEGENVSIALLGGTGAGKSTLINTLLGADLLPTHSFRTCTSAAIEISHSPTKQIAVQLEFISAESWENEKQAFLDEIRESQAHGQNLLSQQDFIYKAWSLYRSQAGPPPLPFPLEEMVDLLQNPLPEQLQKYLQQGVALFRYRTAEEVKTELNELLTAQGHLWPLLKRVLIRGPFEALKGGLQLVDLPGLNDPNPAREVITRNYLKQAEFIWLTFNTTRGLTRDVMDILKDRGFMTQVIMDGTISALAFVGTRGDEFVPVLEKQQLNLPQEASLEEILAARNTQIQSRVQEQLSELTLWFSNRYRIQSQIGDVLKLIGQTLAHSPIFMVSALEHQRLTGWRTGEGLFENTNQTGIAELETYMQKILSQQGLQARKKMIRSQCQQMNQEIKRLLQSLQSRQVISAMPSSAKEQLKAKLEQASTEMEHGLRQLKEEIEARSQTAQAKLSQKFAEILSKSHSEMPDWVSSWGVHPWQTLQRAVKEGGRYTSPSSGARLNLSEEISDALLGGLAPFWNAFFVEELENEPGRIQQAMKNLLADFGAEINSLPDKTRLEEIQTSTLSILAEQASQTEQLLLEELKSNRRKLGEMILAETEKIIAKACLEARTLSGAGLKQEILNTLQNHLEKDWPNLAEQTQKQLEAQIQALKHPIQQYFEIMSAVLKDNVRVVSDLWPTARGKAD